MRNASTRSSREVSELKSFKTVIGIAAICVCLMSFGFMANDVDAADSDFGNKKVTWSGFTDNDNGTLTAYITNDGTVDETVKLVVKDYSSGKVLASTEATIVAGEENKAVSVGFGYGSEGKEYVVVCLYESDGTTLISELGPYEIDVKHSIWKDWVTYLVVVVIIIVVIILAYFYIRGAPDRAAKKAEALQGNTKSAPAGRTKYDANSQRKSKRK